MSRYYDWNSTFSRQVGTRGEICAVVGARGIGKTFGLRLALTRRALKGKGCFAEICRTKDESKAVSAGYFDKLQNAGFLLDWEFKIEQSRGYARRADAENDKWLPVCYFVSLTTFQREKKRTYTDVRAAIFDEFIIDVADRYHNYLPMETQIFAGVLNSIFREQPGDGIQRRVYLLANAVDLVNPYFSLWGIDKPPAFGYHYYRGGSVMLHYVEPWDAQTRALGTLVGRMLQGDAAASADYANVFETRDTGDIAPKTATARYAFALVYGASEFAVWIDLSQGWYFITSQVPKDAKNVWTLTKKDMTINRLMVDKRHGHIKALLQAFYYGLLRFDKQSTRDRFFGVLQYIGIK